MGVALFQNGKGWGWLKRSTKHETITNINLMFVDASSDVLGMNLVLGLWRSRVFCFVLSGMAAFFCFNVLYLYRVASGWLGWQYIYPNMRTRTNSHDIYIFIQIDATFS